MPRAPGSRVPMELVLDSHIPRELVPRGPRTPKGSLCLCWGLRGGSCWGSCRSVPVPDSCFRNRLPRGTLLQRGLVGSQLLS